MHRVLPALQSLWERPREGTAPLVGGTPPSLRLIGRLERLRGLIEQPGPEGEQRWPDLMKRVDWLIDAGVIPTEKRDRWDLVRGLRNETMHASIRHLTTPHEALRMLELLAGEIDALFAREPRLDTNAAL